MVETMNLDEAEAKAREALRLLTEIHAARHSLSKQLPSSGKKAWMLTRFAAHDAAYMALRVVNIVSREPVQTVDDITLRPMEGITQ